MNLIFFLFLKAILFVREKDDEELWDVLIQLSRELPGKPHLFGYYYWLINY